MFVGMARSLRLTRSLTSRHNLAGFNNSRRTDTQSDLIKVGQRETAALTRAREFGGFS